MTFFSEQAVKELMRPFQYEVYLCPQSIIIVQLPL